MDRSHLLQRFHWTNELTFKPLGIISGRPWTIIASPVLIYILGTAVHALIILVSSYPNPEWDLLLERWMLVVIYTGVPTIALWSGRWVFYWIRSTVEFDRLNKVRIAPDIREAFMRDFASNIIPVLAGFSVENTGDRDLAGVQVELIVLENYHETKINGVKHSGFLEYPVVHLPIVLEWNPQEQPTAGVAETRIPAGTSRWVGLLDNLSNSQVATILSANHEVRSSLLLLPGRYRISLRLSAERMPAVEKTGYEIEVYWSNHGQCVRFEFENSESGHFASLPANESTP